MTVISDVLRWLIVLVLFAHGLIHLLGAAKGLGLADVAQLKEPIDTVNGVLWFLGALLVLAAAAMFAVGAPSWWWMVATGVWSSRRSPS